MRRLRYPISFYRSIASLAAAVSAPVSKDAQNGTPRKSFAPRPKKVPTNRFLIKRFLDVVTLLDRSEIVLWALLAITRWGPVIAARLLRVIIEHYATLNFFHKRPF